MEALKAAPVFKPSLEEFEDPISFIKSIRAQAESYGIAKIIPPVGWKPPFSVDLKKLRFHTRLQDLKKLSAESRLSHEFAETVRKFNFLNNIPVERKLAEPYARINWRTLYKKITESGGYYAVDQCEHWDCHASEILANNSDGAVLSGKLLQKFYADVLLPYEEAVKMRRQQLKDAASRAEKTPPKLKTDSETPKKVKPSEKDGRSEALLNEKVEDGTNDEHSSKEELEESTPPPEKNRKGSSEGVSSGQIKSLIEIGRQFWRYCPDIDRPLFGTIKSLDRSRASGTRYLIEYKQEDTGPDAKPITTFETVARSQLEVLVANGESPETARAAFTGEICEDCSRAIRVFFTASVPPAKSEEDTTAKSADKNVKEEPASNTTSRCSNDEPSTGVVKEGEVGVTCANCTCHYHRDCARAMHQNSPVLSCRESVEFKFQTSETELDWFCVDCVQEVAQEFATDQCHTKSQSQSQPHRRKAHEEPVPATNGRNRYRFGFDDGEWHTMDSFKKYEQHFLSEFLSDLGEFPEKGKKSEQAGYENKLEERFWKFLAGSSAADHFQKHRINVQYGSDLDTNVHGSGFPRSISLGPVRVGKQGRPRTHAPPPEPPNPEAEAENAAVTAATLAYIASNWNLNNLPTSMGSLLRHLRSAVKGVMVPWLYVGMMFSAFCWHTEDHNLYSINYHHWGKPKVWYGLRGSEAPKFDYIVKSLFPELFERNPDLLLHLVTMINPLELVQQGLNVVRTVQREGEFIVTFPQAYHAGFNQGLNCCEAVNFATPDWLPWGAHAMARYCKFQRTPVFSHEALILAVARSAIATPPGERADCLPFILSQMELILAKNVTTRQKALENGIMEMKLMTEFPGRRKLKRRCRELPAGGEEGSASDEYADFLSTSKGVGLCCSECNQFCFLEATVCARCGPRRVACAEHAHLSCQCEDFSAHTLYQRFDDCSLEEIISKLKSRLARWEAWKTAGVGLSQRIEQTFQDVENHNLDAATDEKLVEISSLFIKFSEVQVYIKEGESLGVGYDQLLPYKKVVGIVEEWKGKAQPLFPGVPGVQPAPNKSSSNPKKVTFSQSLVLLREGLTLPLRPETELCAGVQTVCQALELWGSICEHFAYDLPRDLKEAIKFCTTFDRNTEEKLPSLKKNLKRKHQENDSESFSSEHLGLIVNRVLECPIIMPEIKEVQKLHG